MGRGEGRGAGEGTRGVDGNGWKGRGQKGWETGGDWENGMGRRGRSGGEEERRGGDWEEGSKCKCEYVMAIQTPYQHIRPHVTERAGGTIRRARRAGGHHLH
jgi:hypothetical protein